MRYIFIINNLANVKFLQKLDDAIASVDNELRLRIEMRYTEYPGHAKDIAVEVSEKFGSSIVVVVCGGDGTVHEVVNALAFRNTPMIVLPLGTGNDFVRSVFPFKEVHDLKYMLSNLDNLSYYPIDLIRVDSYDLLGSHLSNWSSYVDNIASIGLDTVVQAKAKAMVRANNNWFNNKTAYLRSAIHAVLHRSSFKLDYKLELENGEVYESNNSEFTLICVCNGQYYGNGFRPSPNAYIDDGIIDVCVVDKVNFFKAAYLLFLYKFGKHVGKSGVHTYRCTSGTITCHDKATQLIGNFDGEDFFGNRIRFEVFQSAINIGVIDKYNPLSAQERSEVKFSSIDDSTDESKKSTTSEMKNIDDSIEVMTSLTESLQVDWVEDDIEAEDDADSDENSEIINEPDWELESESDEKTQDDSSVEADEKKNSVPTAELEINEDSNGSDI